MALSKILITGATGYIGKHLANASVRLGHPTFLFVRSKNPSDPAKAELLKSFTDTGATLVVGDITDHASLVAALKQVEVVICAVDDASTGTQVNTLEAAKEAGTIKRFLPSEFGGDPDRLAEVQGDNPLAKFIFEPKVAVRRAVEKSGIPYTFICSGCFAGWHLTRLGQEETEQKPPRDGKLVILGEGNGKTVFNDETNIGAFTINAVDDPQAANKTVIISAKGNLVSLNEVIAIWEKKIGHTFDKEFVDKEIVQKEIRESPMPQNLILYIKYFIFGEGQMQFELDPSKEMEATAAYPDVKYTTIDEYSIASCEIKLPSHEGFIDQFRTYKSHLYVLRSLGSWKGVVVQNIFFIPRNLEAEVILISFFNDYECRISYTGTEQIRDRSESKSL